MENNFEHRIIEKSLLLRACVCFQWIYTFFGLNLPPILYDNYGNMVTWKMVVLWCLYILYTCILTLLVIWTVYINNISVDEIVHNYDLDEITGVLSVAQYIAVAFVQVIMQLSSYRRRQVMINIRLLIGQLEKDLLCYLRQSVDDEVMGSVTFKQKCQRFRRRLLMGPFVFLLIHTVLLSYTNYPLTNHMMSLRDRILTVFTFQLIQTKCSEYCVMMYVINEFLSTLQQSLHRLKYEMLRAQRQNNVTSRDGGDATFYRKLMAHQFILGRVWCLVQNIEEYFWAPLLTLFVYNGVCITHTINWTYVTSFKYYEGDCCQVYRLWFMALVFLNMLYTCWLSQNCIDKYTQIGSILHNLHINCHDEASKHRLREYSLQMLHQKVEFTCSGFFDINLKSLGLLTLSMVTYVVILIQFKLQEETEKGIRRL